MLPDAIILNGTSGSGKSSIAAALRPELPEPFLHVQVDVFTEMLDFTHPSVYNRPWETGYLWNVLRGYVRCLRTLMEEGNRLIVDAILSGGPGAEVREYADVLSGFSVILVGVRCNGDTAEARQRERGADPDLPRHQANVHDHRLYDIEVDTDALNPELCAAKIVRWIFSEAKPTALDAIRSTASTE